MSIFLTTFMYLNNKNVRRMTAAPSSRMFSKFSYCHVGTALVISRNGETIWRFRMQKRIYAEHFNFDRKE